MAKKEAVDAQEPQEQEEEKRIRTDSEERYLRCDLTDEEFRDKAAALTHAIDDLHNIEEEGKAIKSDLKSRADKAAAEVAGLNNIVRNRYEMRFIRCTVTQDFDAGRVRVERGDTGAVIEDRDMKLAERQRQSELFPDETQAPEGDAETDDEDAQGKPDPQPEA